MSGGSSFVYFVVGGHAGCSIRSAHRHNNTCVSRASGIIATFPCGRQGDRPSRYTTDVTVLSAPGLLWAHGGCFSDHPNGDNEYVAPEGKLRDTAKVSQLRRAERQHLIKKGTTYE